MKKRNWKNKYGILFVLLLLGYFIAVAAAGSQGSGISYYVDSINGNDVKNGNSANSAWKTIDKVNSVQFKPGDKILLKSGSIWTGTLKPQGSGIKGKPIVIDIYGEGTKPIINGDGAANAVYLSGQSFWEINNLEVTNNASSEGDRRGIFIEAKIVTTNHVYVKNCFVHNVRGNNDFSTGKLTGGIILFGDNVGNYNDILIQGNTINNCDRTGILAVESCGKYSTNIVVRNNSINFPGGDGIIILTCTNPLIEYNVCNNSDAVSKGVAAAIWPYECNGAVFQYNEAYNSKLSEDLDDGQAWDVDGSNNDTVYQYNYSHDNQGGMLLVCANETCPSNNSTIRYNISQNDSGRIITLTGPSKNTYFYNNTVYISPKMKTKILEAQDYEGWHEGFYAYNNIFYNLGKGGYDFAQSTKNVFDYNVYFGEHPSNEPADAHKIVSDPMLDNPGSGKIGRNSVIGYKLKSGSPCINSGVTITNNSRKDFWGTAIPQGVATDRGACEYSGTSFPKMTTKPEVITLKPAPKPKEPVTDLSSFGTNLAKGKTAEASSIEGAGLEAKYAVDGNTASRWASAEGVSAIEWIRVDLGSVQNINKVVLKWENALAKAYKIQVSTDDKKYTDVASVTDGKKSVADVRAFASVNARYVKIYCTQKVDPEWGYSLYELEVYGGSNPAAIEEVKTQAAEIPIPKNPNLVVNSGFETNEPVWQDWENSVIVANNARSGTHCLKTGTGSGGRGQAITEVVPGKKYTFIVWGKVSAPGVSGLIGVDLLDDADKATGDQQGITFSETAYTQKSVTFTVPAGTTKFQVFVWKEESEGNGYIYADDFSLTLN